MFKNISYIIVYLGVTLLSVIITARIDIIPMQ